MEISREYVCTGVTPCTLTVPSFIDPSPPTAAAPDTLDTALPALPAPALDTDVDVALLDSDSDEPCTGPWWWSPEPSYSDSTMTPEFTGAGVPVTGLALVPAYTNCMERMEWVWYTVGCTSHDSPELAFHA